jgi:hypothetical protein
MTVAPSATTLKGEHPMANEEDYEAELAAEAQAARWWDDLRMRSVGTMHIPEWSYIWIAVLLRRYAEQCPKGKGLDRYRALNAWQTLIERQLATSDPEAPEYQDHILGFLGEQDGPWLILYDQRQGKWAIRQVGTIDQDICVCPEQAKQAHGGRETLARVS